MALEWDDKAKQYKFIGVEEANKEVDKHVQKKKDERKLKDKLGIKRVFNYIPEPHHLLSILLIVVAAAVFIKYLPVISDWIMEEYVKDVEGKRNMFVASLGVNLGLFALMVIIFLFARIPMKAFLKSSLTRKPILFLLSKNRTLDMIVPKEVDKDMWTIDDESAVIPDPDSIIIGPHNRPVMLGVPEIGVGLNVRNILVGHDIGIDMTVIRQYGRKHEQKMYAAMKSGYDVFLKFAPWLIFMLITAAIFAPWFYAKMGQMDEAGEWRGRYESCRVEMIDAGVVPKDIQPLPPEEGEKEVDESDVRPAFAGISVK